THGERLSALTSTGVAATIGLPIRDAVVESPGPSVSAICIPWISPTDRSPHTTTPTPHITACCKSKPKPSRCHQESSSWTGWFSREMTLLEKSLKYRGGGAS